ncbi:hypothetical protein MYBA111488_20185 [Mycobacterium basiliense]
MGDRFGGGRVTLGAFVSMILEAALLVGVGTHADLSPGPGGRLTGATLLGYVIGFIALFICCGVGKGTVFKLIPSIFAERSRALPLTENERRQWARAMSGALIGFAGSVGALGGVAWGSTWPCVNRMQAAAPRRPPSGRFCCATCARPH